MKTTMAMSVLCAAFAAGSAGGADWPQWGGGPGRNMVNTVEKNVPTDWDVATGHNIKWVAKLGSKSYGNPVVAGGRIYIGSNNEGRYDTKIDGDRSNILCFREEDGAFLWQAVHDKLRAGRVNDWPLEGICSTVYVDGDRVYYLNNRCEAMCLNAAGLTGNANEGLQDEQYAGPEKADVVWRTDLMEELGVFPHNLATSSPLVYENLVLLVTGNGVDAAHLNLPAPTAPSFTALEKATGAIVWDFTVQDRVLHGQWSSPALGIINGKPLAVFPGGDGWIYALEPATGTLVWKFDLNPKDAMWELGGYGTKNNIIATPVFHEGRVYIGVGQDPEHGTSIGHLWCIDASGSGDVTATHGKWHFGNEDYGRTMSTVAIADGLLYTADLAGHFYCLDADTGTLLWKVDLRSTVWGSPMWVDSKVYIGEESGEVTIFRHGRTAEVIGVVKMDNSVYTTPVVANGVLYISAKNKLYAIQAK
jgi:outer membrane protein assembly factor BamB